MVVSIPLAAYRTLPAAALAGKLVLDPINYYPMRDGHIEALDSGRATTSELVQEHLTDAKLVKAFSSVGDHYILILARPTGAADRPVLPIAGTTLRPRRGPPS
ncbi:hypothetical protein E4N62_43305 [Streptomyces sp. MNU76]|uniref:hypothetical protein n=1 Tax=Streptomyces sp. MNU76 TaxID=2560026 RepID=UPI001E410FA3|nr:hypothetical protein [Streptomyces sp. MNU76]MCC9711454.1 hypothetical protein [Streptomyces sp. MNU76]